MGSISRFVGCIPIYWAKLLNPYKRRTNFNPTCKSFDKYKEIYSNYIVNKWNLTATKYSPPCSKMRVSTDVQISQGLVPEMSKILRDANSSLWEFLYLTKEYEDVVNQKSMDLEI